MPGILAATSGVPLVWLFLAAFSLSAPAWGAPALLVPSPEDAEAARDRVQLVAGAAVDEARTYGPDDLQAAVSYRPLVAGAAEAFTCKGPALDQAGFDVRLGRAMEAVDGLEFDQAQDSLMALTTDLPCSVALIGPRQLHDIFFFSGLMAAYRGDKDAAVARFARAISVKGDVPLDTDFPPEAQQLYLLGREASQGQELAHLSLVPPVDARKVWVDGRPQPSAGPSDVELRPGYHLVHIETTEGSQRALGLDLGPGESLWADQRATAAAVLDGESGGPLGMAVEALLETAAKKWAAETLYVAGSSGLFVWGEGVALARARLPLKPTGDRLGLRLGGGVLLREADYLPQPFAYGAPALEFEVALVRGLELGGAVQVGLTSVVADTLSLAPSGALGLQWAWSGTKLRPYAGIRGVLTGVAEGSVRAGGLAVAGVRIQPRRDSPLRLAVGIDFGWAGGIQAGARLTMGLGLLGPR